MWRKIRIIAVIGVCAAAASACRTTQPSKPAPKGPAAPKQPPQRSAPKSVDIASDVMATMVFADFESLLSQGIDYVRPHLPPKARRLVSPGLVKAKLWSKLFRAAPGLEEALDLHRPFGLAIADPRAYRSRGLGPVILAVPLSSPVKLIDILSVAAKQRHRRLDGGDHFFGRPTRGVYVRIVDRVAYVASDERLMQGAAGVLSPRLSHAPKVGARLVVHMARVYGRYKAMIDRGLAKLKRETAMLPDPGFFKYLQMIPSMTELRGELGLRPKAVHVSLLVRSRPGGALAKLAGKLNAGPAWGAEYLPADSVFVMLTRFSPALQKQRLGALVQMAQAALSALPRGLPIGAMLQATANRWHAVVSAVLDNTRGESGAAIWSGKAGGIGFGTVLRATDAAKLRASLVKMASTVGADIGKLAGLAGQLARIRGVKVRIRVRKGAFRAGKVRGDLVTFALRYPRITKRLAGRFNLSVKQARARLRKVRRALTLLFGKTSTMALVALKSASGDQVGLLTFGRDYAARMKAMVAVAQGGPKSRMAGVVDGLVGKGALVALFYSPLALLVEQVMRVADQLTHVPAQLQALVRSALPPAGRDVPLAVWMQTEHDHTALRFTASMSSDLIGLAVKAGMLFLQRATSVPPAPPSVQPPRP